MKKLSTKVTNDHQKGVAATKTKAEGIIYTPQNLADFVSAKILKFARIESRGKNVDILPALKGGASTLMQEPVCTSDHPFRGGTLVQSAARPPRERGGFAYGALDQGA